MVLNQFKSTCKEYCAELTKTTMKFQTNTILKLSFTLLAGQIILLLFSSCNRYALYQVQDRSDTLVAGAITIEKKLEPGDKISVSIWQHDDLSVGSIHTVYNNPEPAGKWVMLNENGEVNLPQVGRVTLKGLTINEAEDQLVAHYSQYIRKPILNVRLMNNYVTVLGEVQRPGNYFFSSDQYRLVDILGQASGLTDYALTTKIKVIRGRESIPVDLTTTGNNEVMIYPRDVIYIPPARNKSIDRVATKLIPIASLLTALALVYNVSVNK